MTAVLLFARAPRVGRVKTRLAVDIGDAPALAIYREVGGRVAARVRQAYRLTVWCDPADGVAEIREWVAADGYEVQAAGDLGARLWMAFATHFERGDRPVIAIGADAPDVTAATIAAAEDALQGHDVVVGPALDGGYYLIGLNDRHPSLFDGIPWGSSSVTEVTLERCLAARLEVAKLSCLRDLDSVADLEALGFRGS